MRALALVDYDNVRLAKDQSPADTEYNADRLFESLVLTLRSSRPEIAELDVRLYGGWVCENGRFSRVAEWLLGILPNLRGRRSGLRVQGALALAPACMPSERLLGTLRLRSKPVRQKMVDVLMAVDAIHFSGEEECVLIVSDDDDMVPGAVSVATQTGTELWLVRRRAHGLGLNDGVLERSGARVEVLVRT